jgi:anti-sigma regulatory factor (Ser/Thr protein kinase)
MTVDLEEIAVDIGEHVVQFYEDESHLAHTVGAYLTRALDEGAIAVVIATEAHRSMFSTELERAGLDPAERSLNGSLILLDAAETLGRFVNGGQVDREAFRAIVGSVLRRAAGTGRPVRAYGEMVALLWDAGDVLAAIELEKVWNELSDELPFSLVCAYPSASVEGHEHADALHEVCDLHTSVVGSAPDFHPALSALDPSRADFAADLQAPRSARHFVADVLERWGHSARLLDDAALVVTELATNAVIHAHSPFSVDIRPYADSIRLSVRDNSRVAPSLREEEGLTASGRGLRIVRALSSQWGVEAAGDGKTVWAELQV